MIAIQKELINFIKIINMISTFVVNGETQLVLTPSSEKEKIMLAEFDGKSIKIEKSSICQILGKSHPDSVIISIAALIPSPKLDQE